MNLTVPVHRNYSLPEKGFTAEAQRREELWVRELRGMSALAGKKMQV
jgi:hypothetical protein